MSPRSRTELLRCLAAALVVLLLGFTAVPVLAFDIDGFNNNVSILVWPEFQFGGTSIFQSPGKAYVPGGAGGELDLVITRTSDPGLPFTASVVNGVFSHDIGAGDAGTSQLVWDGTDGDADAIATTGLSVDLTDGGPSDSFLFTISSATGGTLAVTVYTDTLSAMASVSIDSVITDSTVLELPFTQFGSFDFTNVGAVELVIASANGEDVTRGKFATGEAVIPTAVKQLSMSAADNGLPAAAGTIVLLGCVVAVQPRRRRNP